MYLPQHMRVWLLDYQSLKITSLSLMSMPFASELVCMAGTIAQETISKLESSARPLLNIRGKVLTGELEPSHPRWSPMDRMGPSVDGDFKKSLSITSMPHWQGTF